MFGDSNRETIYNLHIALYNHYIIQIGGICWYISRVLSQGCLTFPFEKQLFPLTIFTSCGLRITPFKPLVLGSFFEHVPGEEEIAVKKQNPDW